MGNEHQSDLSPHLLYLAFRCLTLLFSPCADNLARHPKLTKSGQVTQKVGRNAFKFADDIAIRAV